MKNRPPNDEVVSEMTKRHAEPSPVSHENDDPDTEVALRPSFATGFRVGAESATLQQRRVSWGNLLWSDFTAQQPYVTSVPFSTSSDNNGKSSLVNAEPYQPKSDWPLLPRARGQLSEFVLGSFKSDSTFSRMLPSVQVADPLNDDDFQLALFLCYELHYRSVSYLELEWDPVLLSLRRDMEDVFVRGLRRYGYQVESRPEHALATLDAMVQATKVKDVAEYLEVRGTLDQMREYCVLRSVSLLRSGDASAFGVARLKGRAKAAMARIQFGELGCGDARAMNSSQFSTTMTSLQLDPNYGAYTDHLPAVSLAAANLEWLFGLHQKWRGALVGQLTVGKMLSVDAMDHCCHAMQRLEGNAAGSQYFDARLNTDPIHAFIARNQLVAGLLETDPTLIDDVLFGARAHLALEDNLAHYVLAAWSKDHSSLLPWSVTPQVELSHVIDQMNGTPHEVFEHGEQRESA